MSLIQLSLETLKELDGGRPALAFQHAVETAVLDCKDRPMDKRARKVTLSFTLQPVPEESNIPGVYELASIEGDFKVTTSVPDRQTKTYSFGLNRQGRLFFSEASPDNVEQTTFDDRNANGRVERNFE